MSKEKRYYLLKWSKVTQPGFPRYEVRPMPVYPDNDYIVLLENVPFQEANKELQLLQEEENTS